MSGSVSNNAGRGSGVIAPAGGGGKLLAMETVRNGTRTALSSTTTWVSVISASYTKISATSDLIVSCLTPMYSSSSTNVDIGITDGTTVVLGSWQYNVQAYIKMSYTIANFGTLSAASHTISWGYRGNNSASDPAPWVNPNATTEQRFTQQYTTFIFSEVEA